MKLYDDCIRQAHELLAMRPLHEVVTGAGSTSWPDAGSNQLIFKSDTAYELGGGTLPALSGVLLTSSASLVPDSRITLCGSDLPQLDRDVPYARLALIRVKEAAFTTADPEKGGNRLVSPEGNEAEKQAEKQTEKQAERQTEKQAEKAKLYQAIRRIEFTRFHINPEGFMMRISTGSQRESARISRSALSRGLSFSHIGSAFRQAYEKQDIVEAVHTIFVTDAAFAYADLARVLRRAEDITKALDHLLQNLKMDCDACHLREICAEVEAMCEEPTG